MNLNWGVLKFQFGNRYGENIKITPKQLKFVLKLSVDLRLGMICTMHLNWGFLKSSLETDLEKKSE